MKRKLGDAEMVASTTSVYVTGLPAHIGELQLGDTFKEYGKVHRVKIYRDKDENAKVRALLQGIAAV